MNEQTKENGLKQRRSSLTWDLRAAGEERQLASEHTSCLTSRAGCVCFR